LVVRSVTFEGQEWQVGTQRIRGGVDSIMPGAEHFVTTCSRQ
jgi:hypothetical protein